MTRKRCALQVQASDCTQLNQVSMELARECYGATSYDRGRHSGSDRGTLRSLWRRADVRLPCRGPVSLAARANVVTPLAGFQTPALSGVFFGAGRGSRIPTVSPPADFESAASTSSAIPATGAGRAVRALPGGRKGGIIAESCGGAKRDALGPAKGSSPIPFPHEREGPPRARIPECEARR